MPRGAKEVEVCGREGTCKEVIGESGDVSVICRPIGIIRAARKGVGAICGAWFMDKGEIVIAECQNVSGDTAVDMLGGTVILQILVVGDDGDAVSGAHEEVAPVFEALNDGKELPVPDWVVLLSLGEGFRVRTDHSPSPRVVRLV